MDPVVVSERGHKQRIATLLPYPISEPGGVSTFVRGLYAGLERDFDSNLCLVVPDRFLGRAGRILDQLRLAIHELQGLLAAEPDIVHSHEHPALLAAAVA